MTISPDLLDDAIRCLSQQPETEKTVQIRRRLEAVRGNRCSEGDHCRFCPVNCRTSLCAA